MRNTPWQLSSYRFWKLGAPSATVPPSSTGSCSVASSARDVGAWVGLTPRRFQSGETDYDLAAGGRTVARAALRGRNRDPDPGALCQLRSWALALKKRLGFKRAVVAQWCSMSCGRPERTSIPTTGSLPERDHRSHDLITHFSTSPAIG